MDRNTMLGDAGMSVRGVNALNADGIVTVGDLADKVASAGERYLRRIPNFGAISRDQALEILDSLKAKNAALMLSDATLRDWFAGQALAAECLWVDPLEGEIDRRFPGQTGVRRHHLAASRAYTLADAMLAAREGRDNA